MRFKSIIDEIVAKYDVALKSLSQNPKEVMPIYTCSNCGNVEEVYYDNGVPKCVKCKGDVTYNYKRVD